MSNARRRSLGGLLVILVPLLAVGCRDDSRRTEGPLQAKTDDVTMISGSAKRGQFYVVGVSVPENTSGHDVVLERLEPAEPRHARGLEMRYAAVRVPNRGCKIGSARGWPPLGCPSRLRPVDAFRVPSGAHTQVLVGARSPRLGRWSIPAFRLHYRLDDRRYETTYDQGLTLRIVRRLKGAHASASFSSFQTEARNIGCSYMRATKVLRCAIRTGRCYEMKIVGDPRPACVGQSVPNGSARVLKAKRSWLYRGFRCYAGRASVRCRNQVFEGFFLSPRRSKSTA